MTYRAGLKAGVTVDSNLPVKHLLDCSGIDLVFLFTNIPAAKRLFSVSIQNRHHSLQEDGPGVEAFVNKVHRAPRELDTILQSLALSSSPGKAGKSEG